MKIRLLTFPIMLGAALLVFGCRQEAPPAPANQNSERGNPFDNFLHTEITPADGFDFPFGDPDGKGSYTDKATGAHTKRPELAKCLKVLKKGDTLVVWKLNQLSRSLHDLI